MRFKVFKLQILLVCIMSLQTQGSPSLQPKIEFWPFWPYTYVTSGYGEAPCFALSSKQSIEATSYFQWAACSIRIGVQCLCRIRHLSQHMRYGSHDSWLHVYVISWCISLIERYDGQTLTGWKAFFCLHFKLEDWSQLQVSKAIISLPCTSKCSIVLVCSEVTCYIA